MTKTEVANKALVNNLGLPRISDIDDADNNSAITCKAVFDDSRQFYLREAAPGFARKEIALAIEAGETLPSEQYEYIYGYPSDCMKIRNIYNPAGEDAPKIQFEIGAHSVTATSRVILTDQEDAILVYTRDIENLNMFSDDDIEALSFLLAWKVAMPLTRKRELANDNKNDFMALLAVAKKNNKRAQHKPIKKLTRYVDARR